MECWRGEWRQEKRFQKALRSWPRSRLFRQCPLACAPLRVRIPSGGGHPKHSSSPDLGPCVFTEVPSPLKGLGGVRSSAWAGGMEPWDLANFPLATSPQFQFPALRYSPRHRSTLAVHAPTTPPPHRPLGYIADHISLSLWFQPRPARGTWPSRHARLGRRDGSSPTTRKQLPRIRLTSPLYPLAILVSLNTSKSPYRHGLDSCRRRRRRQRRRRVWRSRFTVDQDAADAHADAHALHTTTSQINNTNSTQHPGARTTDVAHRASHSRHLALQILLVRVRVTPGAANTKDGPITALSLSYRDSGEARMFRRPPSQLAAECFRTTALATRTVSRTTSHSFDEVMGTGQCQMGGTDVMRLSERFPWVTLDWGCETENGILVLIPAKSFRAAYPCYTPAPSQADLRRYLAKPSTWKIQGPPIRPPPTPHADPLTVSRASPRASYTTITTR